MPPPGQPVAGAADFVLSDNPHRTHVSLPPVALAMVGHLAHRDCATFEVGDAPDHTGDVPRHLRRQAGQAVDAWAR